MMYSLDKDESEKASMRSLVRTWRKPCMEGLSSASVLWEMKLQQAAHTAAWVIPANNCL